MLTLKLKTLLLAPNTDHALMCTGDIHFRSNFTENENIIQYHEINQNLATLWLDLKLGQFHWSHQIPIRNLIKVTTTLRCTSNQSSTTRKQFPWIIHSNLFIAVVCQIIATSNLFCRLCIHYSCIGILYIYIPFTRNRIHSLGNLWSLYQFVCLQPFPLIVWSQTRTWTFWPQYKGITLWEYSSQSRSPYTESRE